MNNTNFKISSPFLSCFNNLSGLYFEALVSRFWRGLVGSKFLLFHGSEEESVYYPWCSLLVVSTHFPATDA